MAILPVMNSPPAPAQLNGARPVDPAALRRKTAPLLLCERARAMEKLGLARGERVAIMGEACEEWMICDLAAQSLGGIVYGIYPTAAPSEVEYQMCDGGASIFIAEDQEYIDRVLLLADCLPALRHIVVIDDSAIFAYSHPKLVSYRAVLEQVEQP